MARWKELIEHSGSREWGSALQLFHPLGPDGVMKRGANSSCLTDWHAQRPQRKPFHLAESRLLQPSVSAQGSSNSNGKLSLLQEMRRSCTISHTAPAGLDRVFFARLVQGLQMHSTISKALATSGAAREEPSEPTLGGGGKILICMCIYIYTCTKEYIYIDIYIYAYHIKGPS